MKPDWDELGEKFEKSKKVLIGDVDCTKDDNKDLCEKQGVKGYPTLKYYVPGDRDGEIYEGGRTLDDFKKFVKTLGPPCGPTHLSKCTDEQKETLLRYLATPVEELQAQAAEAQKTLEDAKTAHDELLKSLQAQFEESSKKMQALDAEKGPPLKLMKAAIANLTAPVEPANPKQEL